MDSHQKTKKVPKGKQSTKTILQKKAINPCGSDEDSDYTILDYVVVLGKYNTKSPVWKYFGTLFNNATDKEEDEGYNFCNVCLTHQQSEFQSKLLENIRLKPNLQIRSIHKFKRGTSTGNLSNHLIDVHKLSTKEQIAFGDATKKLTQYFGVDSDKKSATDRNYLLSRRLAILCARSLISYNAVSSDSIAFTDFLKSYNIVIKQGPDRRTLTRSALSDVYFEMVPVIKEIVKDLKYCAITLDLWTDSFKRNGYITFNLSFINDDFELHNINLKTGLMPIKHGAAEIAEQYFNTLKFFGIENVSIYVVGDKGSNIIKFINDEKLDHQHCLGHGIHNLVNVDGFEAIPEINDVLKKIKKIVKKLRFRSVQLEKEDKKVQNEILTRIDELDEALLNDLFEGTDDDEGFSAEERLPLALVSLLNDESDPVRTIEKGRYISVKSHSETRWHSILIMCESLGTQRAAVNRVIPTLKKPITINTEEWDLVMNLIRFLKVFKEAVESFSYEKKPTLPSALIFRMEIESVLTPSDDDHFIITELKEKMLSRLDFRFPITDEILIGALLDPRLQHLPRLQSELEKRNVTKYEFLKSEIKKVLPEPKPTTEDSSISEQSEPSSLVAGQPKSSTTALNSRKNSKAKAKKKQPSILSTLIKKHSQKSNPTPTNEDPKVDEEIHKYFLTVIPDDKIDDFNILSFWKDNKSSLPLLGELVKKYLCIPLTSTSSERAFSYAGILISAKRSSLSPYVVEKTLFIHDNYELVKKTLFANIENNYIN